MDFFDVDFMTAIPVASVNLKCGATLLQQLTWKVSQPRAAKTRAEYAARPVAPQLNLLEGCKNTKQETSHVSGLYRLSPTGCFRTHLQNKEYTFVQS